MDNNYKTSYYTTVNINVRLHPSLPPKAKILFMEIVASQTFLEEQEPTNECLSALTNICVEEIPTLLTLLETENFIKLKYDQNGLRYFDIEESLCL